MPPRTRSLRMAPSGALAFGRKNPQTGFEPRLPPHRVEGLSPLQRSPTSGEHLHNRRAPRQPDNLTARGRVPSPQPVSPPRTPRKRPVRGHSARSSRLATSSLIRNRAPLPAVATLVSPSPSRRERPRYDRRAHAVREDLIGNATEPEPSDTAATSTRGRRHADRPGSTCTWTLSHADEPRQTTGSETRGPPPCPTCSSSGASAS